MTRRSALLAAALCLPAASLADAPERLSTERLPAEVGELRFEQRPGERVPGRLLLRDSEDKPLRVEGLLRGRPVVLVLVYYRCPRLCSLVLNNLIDGLREVPFDAGKDYDVAVVSFDPEETYELAAGNRELALQRYNRPGAEAGWHFLTGEEKAVRPLADAVGFRYHYDPQARQFRHAAGLVVLTGDGRVSRYLFGVDFAPNDLRLAITEAGEGNISAPVENALLLTCFAYDPATGRYTPAAMKIMRAGAALTVLLVAVYVGRQWWRGRKQVRAEAAGPLPAGQ